MCLESSCRLRLGSHDSNFGSKRTAMYGCLDQGRRRRHLPTRSRADQNWTWPILEGSPAPKSSSSSRSSQPGSVECGVLLDCGRPSPEHVDKNTQVVIGLFVQTFPPLSRFSLKSSSYGRRVREVRKSWINTFRELLALNAISHDGILDLLCRRIRWLKQVSSYDWLGELMKNPRYRHSKHSKLLKAVCNAGFSPRYIDADGHTCLHIMLYHLYTRHPPPIEDFEALLYFLCEKGVNFFVRDKRRKMAWELGGISESIFLVTWISRLPFSTGSTSNVPLNNKRRKQIHVRSRGLDVLAVTEAGSRRKLMMRMVLFGRSLQPVFQRPIHEAR